MAGKSPFQKLRKFNATSDPFFKHFCLQEVSDNLRVTNDYD
jgi:hypothetical protein